MMFLACKVHKIHTAHGSRSKVVVQVPLINQKPE